MKSQGQPVAADTPPDAAATPLRHDSQHFCNKNNGMDTASYGLITMLLALTVLTTVLQVEAEAHTTQLALTAISAFSPPTVGLVSTILLSHLPQVQATTLGTCYTVSACNYSINAHTITGTIGTNTPTVGTCNGFVPAISQGRICKSSDCQSCEPLADKSGKIRGCISHGGETDSPFYEVCF